MLAHDRTRLTTYPEHRASRSGLDEGSSSCQCEEAASPQAILANTMTAPLC